MSYIVTPIVIDLDALRSRLQAHDLTLLAGIERDAKQIDRDLDDDGPTTLEHARRIVMGEATDEWPNAKYGYGLQLICEHLGDFQQNDHWSAMSSSWFTQVDAALKEAGCPFSLVAKLFYSGPPTKIPRPDDFPGMGHLDPDQVAGLCESLQQALPALPAQEKKSVAQAVRWLDAARGVGIVTFYS